MWLSFLNSIIVLRQVIYFHLMMQYFEYNKFIMSWSLSYILVHDMLNMLNILVHNKFIIHTCSWHDKLIILWILNRQAKISLCMQYFDSINFINIILSLSLWGPISTVNGIITCHCFTEPQNNCLVNVKSFFFPFENKFHF